MTRSRAIATGLAAFFVSQILTVIIHGFILGSDYEPFRGTLLRAADVDPPWQMLFLPIVHLAVVVTLVWLYARLRLNGSKWSRGLTLGLVAWTMSQVPVWLIWYAQQPWPGVLVLKQLSLELVSSMVIGLTIALVAPAPKEMNPQPVARP
jgi:hypothetical protein